MKKWIVEFKVLDVIFVLFFTGILVKDFFPNVLTGISQSMLLLGIVAVLIAVAIIKNYKEPSDKESFYWQVCMTSYFIGIIILLTALGGKSNAGLNFTDPLLWFVLVIVLTGLFSRFKKIRA